MPIETREPVQIFDTTAGFAPVRNLIAIGNPNVHKFGDQWWMFVGAAHTGGKVNVFSASASAAPVSVDLGKSAGGLGEASSASAVGLLGVAGTSNSR